MVEHWIVDPVVAGSSPVIHPNMRIDREKLEILYQQYNHREFVHPDPLEFLYRYESTADWEIVGLVASSLAYGNVKQILSSVSKILDKLGVQPSCTLKAISDKDLRKLFIGFKHRWHTEDDLASLLIGIKRIIFEFGSLKNCFLRGFNKTDANILPALSYFVSQIILLSPPMRKNLLPHPQQGSACKRLFMYLRWMVRKDNVDPGGWHDISADKLLIPLDTHMFRIGRLFRLTKRKQADLTTAWEMTKKFREIIPDDPVRYDFVLTRPGIWKDKILMKEMRSL